VTWPLLVSLTLSLSLNFVDSFFLARISDRAAAATGALLPLLGATLVIFIAVGQAGASVASQLIGARRYDEVPITYLALVTFNLLLGLGTSSLFFLLRYRLPEWLGLAGELRADASTYLGVLGSFQFLKATQIAYGNILNSRGQTQWVLAEALITNICNIALNFAFLHGVFGVPRLGVAGVALSTVLSLAVGLAFTMCVAHLRLRVRFPRQLSLSQLKGRLRQVLRIGLPSAVEPISYQCSQMVVNALVISWGAQALAARTYVINFVTVTTILWGAAFGIGTQVMVAHRVGAQDFDDANAQMKKALRFAVLGNLALSTLVAAFHAPLLSTLTVDPKIHEFAAPLFWLGLLVEPCRAVNIVAGGALRSSGDARYTALVGMLMMWSVGVPACYLFGRWLGYGLPGVWLGLFVDELVRGFINHRRWRAGRWQEFGLGRKPASG
jgi:putative MATE family efflux protein